MSKSPKPSGGIPTWLIVLIVIFLFLVLGCCGGFYACTHFLGKVATVGAEKIREHAQKTLEESQKESHDSQTQKAQDLKTQGPQISPTDLPARTEIPHENTTPANPLKTVAIPEVTTKMPSNFPADIPVHDGMTPTNSVADKIHGAGSVTLESTDNVDTLADFYEKQMAAKGWTIDTNTTINGNTVQSYSKDTRTATISIISDGGKSHVSITYAPK